MDSTSLGPPISSSPPAAADPDAEGARAPVAAPESCAGRGVGGSRLTLPSSAGPSGEPSARFSRAQTQSSDEGLSDSSCSATAASSAPFSPAAASDAAPQLVPPSTSASAPASGDQPFNKGTTGQIPAASAGITGGESVAELRATSQSLLQKLNEEKQRNEDLLNRVMELVSQMYQKENQLYAYRLSELGAHSRIVFVSFLFLTPMSLLIYSLY